jgi:GNAT superfamily N-acetyltransferase
MTTRVQTAHADAWEVHGGLRAGTRALRGVRCMASGLAHPQWNNGDVSSPDADIDGARAFYDELAVPWGMRVPVGIAWSAGQHLFRKRLMGLLAEDFTPAPAVPDLTIRAAQPSDFETVRRIDAAAFGADAGPWIAGQLGREPVLHALAELDGQPVASAYSLLSDGLAGPCLYVAGVGVLESARRRGVGAAISSWLIERGLEEGAELAHLHPDSDEAARVYQRLGFVESAGLDIYVKLFANQ